MLPTPVRVTIAALAALILFHLAIPVVMMANKAALRADTVAARPGLTPEQLDAAIVVALVAAALFHVLFCIAYGWLGLKLIGGRRWARAALTTTLVLATVFSVVSWASSAMFHTAIIAGDLTQLVLIGLLWTPASVGAFLARGTAPTVRP